MCEDCGCTGGESLVSQGVAVKIQPRGRSVVKVESDLLARNSWFAGENRKWLRERRVTAINLISSPGSGKTTLLERTLHDLKGELALSVIEGDQATERDAQRIRATGCPAVQLLTGTGCHLDARSVAAALEQLDPAAGGLCFVENVGNLVCPSLFDLGEAAKVVILSVTEGEDKPLKYPHSFKNASLVLLSKVDLLEHLDFDMEECRRAIRTTAPELPVLEVSARRGTGMSEWYAWLRQRIGEGQSA